MSVQQTAKPSLTPSGMAIDATDSSVIVLSPEFLEALRNVVPKRRRAKLPYIVGLGLLAVIGIVGTDRSTREFVAERWHHAPTAPWPPVASSKTSAPAMASVVLPPPAMTDQRPENAVAPVASTIEATSATAATGTATTKPKKARPHRSAPKAKERIDSGA